MNYKKIQDIVPGDLIVSCEDGSDIIDDDIALVINSCVSDHDTLWFTTMVLLKGRIVWLEHIKSDMVRTRGKTVFVHEYSS